MAYDLGSEPKDPSEKLAPILQEVQREGLIRLFDYILQRQVNKQPLTALEVHRHFLESTKGTLLAVALGEKKLLQRLADLELVRLRKQVGKATISCMELTEKGAQYLQTLRNTV